MHPGEGGRVRRDGLGGLVALPGGDDVCLLPLTSRLLFAAAAAAIAGAGGLAASAGSSEQAYSGRREAADPTVLQ